MINTQQRLFLFLDISAIVVIVIGPLESWFFYIQSFQQHIVILNYVFCLSDQIVELIVKNYFGVTEKIVSDVI